MTKWTKGVANDPGEYIVAYKHKVSPPRGEWLFAVWAVDVGELPSALPQSDVIEDVWRSVDPISPPVEDHDAT